MPNSLSTDIAFVIDKLNAGGAQRVLSILANYWALQGRKVCIITYNDTEEDFFVLDKKVHRIIIPSLKPSKTVIYKIFQNIRCIIAIRMALKKASAKVSIGFIAITNIRLILASFGLGLKVIISERNDPSRQSFGFMWDLLRKFLYKFADVVTANSNGALKTLSSYVSDEKLFLVPNPLQLSVLNDNRIDSSHEILTVGRLVPQKAHDILLDAFAKVASRNADWRLTIIGDGILSDELQRQAERLGIAECVTWLANVRDPFKYYKRAGIFVLVSRYEGIPNALLEAMSCELPVIVSDSSPGPLEYVKHKTTGLVVPVNNATALEDSINRLIHDPQLRIRIGKAARTRVAECNLPIVMKNWEKVLGFKSNIELGKGL